MAKPDLHRHWIPRPVVLYVQGVAGEDDPVGKVSVCKQEDLSSSSQQSNEKAGHGGDSLKFCLWEGRDVRIPGAC